MSNKKEKLKIVESDSTQDFDHQVQNALDNVEQSQVPKEQNEGALTIKDLLNVKLGDPECYYKPEKWVATYHQFKNISYDYKTDSVLENGHRQTLDTYKAGMRLMAKVKGTKGLTKQTLDDAVSVWMERERKRFLNDFCDKISHQPSTEDLVAKWVEAATGKQDPCDVAVMRHFIWQVRRKLFGLPVEHHMMPILYGKTGGGKSRAVKELLDPVDDVCMNLDLSIFSESFRKNVFNKAFVIFFDEMARSERADIDELKRMITANTYQYTVMYSQRLETGKQNCTFIGASNDLVYDRIYDPTSARRYWQLNCSDMLDWGTINSIDYMALWRSVDEKSECPVKPYLGDIKRIQESKIRSKDLIEEWLISQCQAKSNLEQSDFTTKELYGAFRKWCQWQNIIRQPTFGKFQRQLPINIEKLGWEVKSRHGNRGTIWPIEVRLEPELDEFAKRLNDRNGGE